MARFSRDKNSAPILKAADYWREHALLGEQAVLTEGRIWTAENLLWLKQNYIDQPDLSERKFYEKLETQLVEAPADVVKLTAELIWLMYLCPSNKSPKTKRDDLQRVLGWRNISLPTGTQLLSDDALAGVGSAGVAFFIKIWTELSYLIRVLLEFRSLDEPQRQELLGDGWRFANWLEPIPENKSRQMRHMLLYLLFPDSFERIFGGTDRRDIVAGLLKKDVRSLTPVQIDQDLAVLRAQLESEFPGREIDFYLPEITERWAPPEKAEERSQDDGIRALLSEFLKQAQEGKSLKTDSYLPRYRGLNVEVSFGKGNFARIPWIAFLEKGQVVSKGIYPVLLYFREEQWLLLCYGVSETNDPNGSWGDLKDAPTVTDWFLKNIGHKPDRYGTSYVSSAYDLRGNSIETDDLKADLERLIDLYKVSFEDESHSADEREAPATSLEIREDLAGAVSAFATALRASHVDFGNAHTDLVRALVVSLVTKPFVMLTGLSGSGKTQIAIRLGEWFGRDHLHVAAVRPDWTGAEALFGYEDGLKPALNGRPVWVVPAALEFILRAVSDPQHPYLLLLDEMNLAHVERYFADVLSGMESGQNCLPNLSRDSDGLWRVKSGASARIPFPKNLWIVGTVNVDETTYMFSPKVLDRANTFEFRVSSDDFRSEAKKPVSCIPGDQALIRGLLAIANNASWHAKAPLPRRDELAGKLRQLHAALSRFDMEFGHRVYYESTRFAVLGHAAGFENLELILDRLVLQKILPRMHGSRRKLELPLLAIAHFCRDLPLEIAQDERLGSMEPEKSDGSVARLPASYAKVCRMLRNLRANQFASFTE